MAWKSGRLFASQRIRRDFWTLSRESLLIERAKNGTSRWSCNAEASWPCGKKSNVSNVVYLFTQTKIVNEVHVTGLKSWITNSEVPNIPAMKIIVINLTCEDAGDNYSHK